MFGSLTREQFLERHWQRRPLVLRGAMPGFTSPISPDELAGLACEEDVEARLVRGRVGGRWTLEHGPFEESRFERLPKRDWTLLVQDVDKHVPELAALLEPFRFIPDWRIDDIMISFAAPGGSVGPHTDRYDVFLLQAAGRRRWQWTERFDPALCPDAELKILAQFTPEEEFVAEPGDILYLPPNVAHFGVALDEAMTFSIGFRAPDQRELVTAFAEELAAHLLGERQFADPGRAPAAHPTRLEAGDLGQLRELLRSGLAVSDASLDAFIGRYLTRPKPHLAAPGEAETAEAVARQLARGERLVRRPGSRWTELERDSGVWLFAEGEKLELEPADRSWLEPLLAYQPLARDAVPERNAAFVRLATLLEAGALEWESAEV